MSLVIVESPNKIKKISSILGKDFLVMASFGHIRGLSSKKIGIDKRTLDAEYKVTKPKVVSELRKAAKKALSSKKTIYIATDLDREGEGIAWHIMDELKLSYPTTRRMVFNEITKSAITSALEEANTNGRMNTNAVDSYKARSFMDKIAGFTISPQLWKYVKGAKSGGRVQSVATRLVVDKEKEIHSHIPSKEYKVSGIFSKNIFATLFQKITDRKEVIMLLEYCKKAIFTISNKKQKLIYNSPPPPYTTSSYQQDVGKRYNISPKEAMSIAQKLYEKGVITYHRTDVTILSKEFVESCEEYVIKKYGKEYYKGFVKKSKKKGEQAAHEAIRPTHIEDIILQDISQKEQKVYTMIWKRALASIMEREKCHIFLIEILLDNTNQYWFVASFTKTIFPGYTILYDNKKEDVKNKEIETINNGDIITYKKIESLEYISNPPNRFTESTLVKGLEKKGIGRPSTYANIISTIQERKYVHKKKNVVGTRNVEKVVLEKNTIQEKTTTQKIGDTKQRLFPTELGTKTTSFLEEHIHTIMDYTFTSNMEQELDNIANGSSEWKQVVFSLQKSLEKLISSIPSLSSSSTTKTKKMSKVILGLYNNYEIEVKNGPYGQFLRYNGKNYSFPKEEPTLEDAIERIGQKKNISKSFFSYEYTKNNKKGKIEGKKGKYGNYITFQAENTKPESYFVSSEYKTNDELFSILTLEECVTQIEYVENYRKNKKK